MEELKEELSEIKEKLKEELSEVKEELSEIKEKSKTDFIALEVESNMEEPEEIDVDAINEELEQEIELVNEFTKLLLESIAKKAG